MRDRHRPDTGTEQALVVLKTGAERAAWGDSMIAPMLTGAAINKVARAPIPDGDCPVWAIAPVARDVCD